MADQGKQQRQDDEDAADEVVAKDSGRKKRLLLAAVAAALLLTAVGLSWLALSLLSDGAPASAETAEAETAEPKAPALYLTLDPPFLANYTVNGRQQYVQVAVAVLAREQDVLDGINVHMPLIRNRLVLLLGGERFSQLQTDEGREQLREKMLAAIREILQKEIGKPGVEQVLFTNFVMQ